MCPDRGAGLAKGYLVATDKSDYEGLSETSNQILLSKNFHDNHGTGLMYMVRRIYDRTDEKSAE
jgi:hypothetical protein